LDQAGRPAEGLPLIEIAMRLDPHYPYLYLFWLGHALHSLERYEEAAAAYRRVISRNPDFFYAHLFLAAAYAQLGRMEEAKAEAAAAMRINAGPWAQRCARHLPYKDAAALARLLDGMRKAGVPE
jgi:tetratricopeptide (TPR) repeat protein